MSTSNHCNQKKKWIPKNNELCGLLWIDCYVSALSLASAHHCGKRRDRCCCCLLNISGQKQIPFFFVPSRPVTTWVLYYSKKKAGALETVLLFRHFWWPIVCVCVCVRACAREEINTTVGLCMRSFCGLFSSFSSSCFICCSSFSHGRRKFALAPNHIDLVNRHFHLQHQCGWLFKRNLSKQRRPSLDQRCRPTYADTLSCFPDIYKKKKKEETSILK